MKTAHPRKSDGACCHAVRISNRRVAPAAWMQQFSSVRLKVEQNQLVSGGQGFDLGTIGLQGA